MGGAGQKENSISLILYLSAWLWSLLVGQSDRESATGSAVFCNVLCIDVRAAISLVDVPTARSFGSFVTKIQLFNRRSILNVINGS